MAPDRRRAVACGVLLALALAAAPASAAMYTCTDASGRKFTADRPPPECANLPVRELRADGSVRRVIEPPPTEEQRKARAEQAQRALQEQEAKRSQARRDIALLETYAASADIEAARRAALVSRQAMIDRSKQRLETLAAERKTRSSSRTLRLQLRFLLPLLVTLVAAAYLAVPLLDSVTLRWFSRDLNRCAVKWDKA